MRQAGRQSPAISRLKEGDPGHSLQEGRSAALTGGAGSGGRCRAGLVPRRLLSGHGACSWPRSQGRSLPSQLLQGWTATPPAMMPGQIPDPSMTAGSLPGLGPLTRLLSSALTAEELKYTDIHNIGAMIAPLHFLEVKLGKRPQPVKTRRGRGAEEKALGKNKVAAARCQNKKMERTEFLQQESEWLELMNEELKTQMEELKQKWQQLMLMLNRQRPTCIVRTDSVRTPDSEGNLLL
ncbi:LOW QUALITY PROTEIN: hypothetical protein QTO34_006914 [Cnephaeus nilssonii]|uniref:BZIP domain-containing protein n=1 Tax=Cnephaeus nilssonii TaxID=3371016 RepID=A0AA40HJ98_CNENI|nr:LOW QUALITY PROTEIN: hypothetical protein QTO34_006914 [Eptesicus nilssonii]